jgi:hypothetical protein
MYSKINNNPNGINSGSNYSAVPEIGILYKLAHKHQYSNSDILEGMTRENHFLKRSSLNQILDMVNDRIYAKDKQINNIDKAICDLHTQQFQINTTGYSDTDRKLNTSLDQACSKLEIDKAKAELDAWQDIMKLRKELMPLITEYLSSIRKMEILNGNYKPYRDKRKYNAEEDLPEFPVRTP